MKIQAIRLCVQTSVWVLASALCVTTLTGCGANGNFTSSLGSNTAAGAISGTVHGGPNPVVGATVTLYATSTVASPGSANSYGYGQAGTVLGTATSGANGAFTITRNANSCTGQQVYITAAGGNAGAGTNSAALLMAALGPCSGISSTTNVFINEPTTIAAAYTLSGFMSVSGTTVNISAPANNNAATPSCTTSSGVTTGCSAAGLAHAFLNAANLVNANTGGVNSTFSTGSSSTVTATVPQMLINTLANTVEACINSNGDIVTATAPCTVLMTNTTPTALNFSATAPTNTLQALLDLAQYPSMATNTAANVTTQTPGTGAPLGASAGDANPSLATLNLFNVANSNAFYAPALTAAPDDFTIAVNYALAPAGTVTGNGIASAVNVWGLGTDISDNVYAYTRMTAPVIYSLTSNGTQLWSTVSSTTCGYSSTGARCVGIPDTLGNLWVVDNAGLTQFNASTGVQGTTYTTVDSLQMALPDVGNNIWLAGYNVGTANGTQTNPSALEEFPQGGSAIQDVEVGGSAVTSGNGSTSNLHDLSFDSAGNLWAGSNSVPGTPALGAVLMISGNNSLTAPSFNYTTSTNPITYNAGAGSNSFDAIVDPSGNVWLFSEDELNENVSTGPETGGATDYSGSFMLQYGGPSGSGNWEAGVVRNALEDGDGKFLVAATSTGAGYISLYYPSAPSDGDAGTGLGGADVYMNPCYVASGSTCSTLVGGQTTTTNVPRGIAIDSTGTIWATYAPNTAGLAGGVIQLFGPGAPTWSQRSWFPAALAPNLAGNATSLRPF